VECETRFSINGLRRLRRSFGIRHRGSSMGEHGLTAAAPRVHPHNEFGRMKTASRPIGAVLALAVAVGLTASLGCTARHRAPLVPEPVGAPVSVVSRGASDRDMYGAGDLWPTRFGPFGPGLSLGAEQSLWYPVQGRTCRAPSAGAGGDGDDDHLRDSRCGGLLRSVRLRDQQGGS
jgi:hypothetical protein